MKVEVGMRTNSFKEKVLEIYPTAIYLQYNGWMQIYDNNEDFHPLALIRLKSKFNADGSVHFNHTENDAWRLAWKNHIKN